MGRTPARRQVHGPLRVSRARSALALAGTLALSCSDDTDSEPADAGCPGAPWSCGAGTTCWPSDASDEQRPAFACLPSDSGRGPGASCLATTGQATCADSLACFQAAGADAGQCVPFCGDGGHTCPARSTCVPVTYVSGEAPVYSVCVPDEGAGGQGGAAGGSGQSGAGGAGAAGSGASGQGGAAGGGFPIGGGAGAAGEAGAAGGTAGAAGGSDASD